MEGNNTKTWITEGILLALVPLLGYFFTFQYESGYAIFFNYPKEFISIELPQVVLTTVILWTAAMMIFMFIEMIIITIPIKQRALFNSIMSFLPLLGFFILSYCTYGWKYAWPYFVVFIILCIPEFAVPLLTQSKEKTYNEKIEANWDSEWKLRKNHDTLSWRLVNIFGHKNIMIVINIFILSQLTLSFGEANAARQRKFFVTSTTPERVILRIYNNKIICAAFDRASKSIKTDIFLYSSGDPEIKNLRLENLGPLKSVRTL